MAASRLSFSFISFLGLFATLDALPQKRSEVQSEPRSSSSTDLSSCSVPLSDGKSAVARPEPVTTKAERKIGNQSLPPPTASLKYITLGRGTQNYTCASIGGTPVSIGAKATLFDTSLVLKKRGISAVEELPDLAINYPLEKIEDCFETYVIGHHYFNGGGQPTFDLGQDELLVGKKVGDILAPSNATVGPKNQPTQDYGAIDWLKLVDAGGSVGLTEVYRVDTAGGKVCACQNAFEFWA